MKCRACHYEKLDEVLNLGELAISDFVAKQPADLRLYEMKLLHCPTCNLLQLEKSVDTSQLYGKYWYRSGTNDSMKRELKDIVNSITKVKKNIKSWLEIACNDGELLSNIPQNIYRVGIDPADNSFTESSKQHANEIIQELFPPTKAKLPCQFDVITAIAMFYDLDDPNTFLQAINTHLKDDGLFVIQLSYTPLMIDQLAFDNICHEHICYYNLSSLMELLDRNGFKIVDCQLNDVNGGSFRVYIQKKTAPENSFATAPYRDVCRTRIRSLMLYEYRDVISKHNYYQEFCNKLENLKRETVSFIKTEKANGKSIWVYGASTKGNTLLQYFGLDNTLIDGAAERSPYKFGLKTIKTDIPIFSEEMMRAIRPDYLLILPWHFIDEFKEREHTYLQNGGKFIVPCPKFEIIGV